MASNVTAQSVLEKISVDHLECHICINRFRQPKVLNCLHSFCLQCLHDLRQSQDPQGTKLKCPLCRKDTILKGSGVADLPNNFVFSALVEEVTMQEKLLEGQGSEIKCQACDEKNQATSRCLDCDHFLCQECQKAHERMKSMKSHKIYTLAQLRSGEIVYKSKLREEVPKYCKHPDQNLNCNIYCNSCQQVIWELKRNIYNFGLLKAKEGEFESSSADTIDRDGSTSSVMASKTTLKVKGQKVQRSQNQSHLQLVLDEANKLTKTLTASERLASRLQLPYIAMGYFNEKGGRLSLEEYGVHLTIPRGAIIPGSTQQVYIYVDPTTPPNNVVEKTEVSLSPSVKCGPEGLRFEESVVLSFPHHAILISERYEKLVVRMCHDDSQASQWQDDNPALVTEKKVFVLVDHFTNFTLVGTPNPGSSTRLKVGAFGEFLDKQCRQYAFRVHVWNTENNVEEYVLKKEENMKSVMLDDFRNLEFFWDSGNLAVKVEDLEDGWAVRGENDQVIDKERIRFSNENSVTFALKRQAGGSEDEGLYCVARSYQQSTEDLKNQTEVRLTICPKQVPDIFTRSGTSKGSISKGLHQQDACAGGNSNCACQQREGAAGLCAYCKERISKGFLTELHGEVEPKEFGGLTKKAVWALCDHLDCHRDGGNNWQQLVEHMTDLPGRSIQVAVESGKVRTKGLLKLYFDVCRDNNRMNKDAIESLVELLSELRLDRAAEIIQDDINKA